jgi:6,7-dimethyl-8-ribityllumazine synthase
MSRASPQSDERKSAAGMRFAICATRWNPDLVEQLLRGAAFALEEKGASVESVRRCAGVFELGPLCARVARKGGIDGIVALGCLIRGATDHYALLATEVTRVLSALALEAATSPQPLAIAFGVLACETVEQASERADPARLNKGAEAALACIEQVHALRSASAEGRENG